MVINFDKLLKRFVDTSEYLKKRAFSDAVIKMISPSGQTLSDRLIVPANRGRAKIVHSERTKKRAMPMTIKILEYIYG